MPTAVLTIDTNAKAANEPLLKQPARQFPVQEIKPKPSPEPSPVQGTQVASLAPGSGLYSAADPAAIDALEVTDYSQRLAAFNARLIQRVYGEIRYPRQAVRRNLQGRLELDVTLQANGELADIKVAHSSGYQILDTAAIKAAEKALSTTDPSELDAVAVAEYGGDSGKLVIPVPVQFLLTN